MKSFIYYTQLTLFCHPNTHNPLKIIFGIDIGKEDTYEYKMSAQTKKEQMKENSKKRKNIQKHTRKNTFSFICKEISQ